MLVRFSKNPFHRAIGFLRQGWHVLLPLTLYASALYAYYALYPLPKGVKFTAVPVSVLGVGLSIFLGFRNKAAYDRWWEARMIWGAIVNDSRGFGSAVLSLLSTHHKPRSAERPAPDEQGLKELQRELLYRHMAWLHALRKQLRKQEDWEELKPYLSEHEFQALASARNKATQLNHTQSLKMGEAFAGGYCDNFRHMELFGYVQRCFDQQGKCERIKNTPLPRFYGYFTRMVLFLFMGLLPVVMIVDYGVLGVPISVLVSFVFWLIEFSGHVSEDPFENNYNDTPMTALCRTIEIDLRQMLLEEELPGPIEPQQGVLM